MPLKKQTGSLLNPSSLMTNGQASQMAQAANAASKYGVSPQTLWGIYGTESSFGANPGTSSAGARGPMQFEPATWAKYGGGGNIMDFAQAVLAAAHYLKDLGANTDIHSPQTIAAVNAYNGNGGGSNPGTSYYKDVLSYGSQYAGTGSTAANTAAGSQASGATGGQSSSALTNVLGNAIGTSDIGGGGLLSNIIIDAFSTLAPVAGSILAVVAKDVAMGIGDFVIIPVWHWNQRAVDTYWSYILNPTVSDSRFTMALPWTAAFWGLGYFFLFTDPDQGNAKPAPAKRSRLGRHVRRAQALPARRELIRPKDVKARTPKKPKERVSRAVVQETGKLRATRTRTVKVAPVNGGNELNSETVRSETSVTRVRPGERSKETGSATGKPDAKHRAGDDAREGRGVSPTESQAGSGRAGDRS